VYMEDGELRGSIDAELIDTDYLYVVETYVRTYEDGTTRTFHCKDKQTAKSNSFSLSMAPFSPYNGLSVVSVEISVESEKRTIAKAKVT